MSPYFQDGLHSLKDLKRNCEYKRLWNDGWNRNENER